VITKSKKAGSGRGSAAKNEKKAAAKEKTTATTAIGTVRKAATTALRGAAGRNAAPVVQKKVLVAEPAVGRRVLRKRG